MIVAAAVLMIILVYLVLIVPGRALKEDMPEFAHRGLHDLERGIPENSMAAFERAVERGVGIELDLHMTSDGEIVVFHDDDLSRICGVEGSIMEASYPDISSLFLSGTEQRIPLFRKVLEMVDGRVPLLIEIKFEKSAGATCSRIDEILKGYTGRYFIQSFDPRCLIWYRRHRKDVKRGQLVESFRKHGTILNPALEFLLRSMALNLFAAPNFISYNILDYGRSMVMKVLRGFYRVRCAFWVIRDKKTAAELQEKNNIVIFEEGS